MGITLRPAMPEDGVQCGRVLYDAFKALADRHGFPPADGGAEHIG